MTLAVIGAAILGAALGSFATVLIARVPHGKDIVFERSHCTACGSQVRWYDNVPIASWLALRGRCRDCSARISPSYPLVEAAVAVLCALTVWRWGIGVQAAMLVVLAPVSVALVVIDVRHRRLPHALVLPMYGVVALGAVGAVVTGRVAWYLPLVGLAVLGGFYAALWFVYPRGLGFGDVTTAGVLGIAAGSLGWSYLAVAAIAGPLVGGAAVLVLAIRGRAKLGAAIPYGPALIAGAWLGFLAGDIVTQGYLGALGIG